MVNHRPRRRAISETELVFYKYKPCVKFIKSIIVYYYTCYYLLLNANAMLKQGVSSHSFIRETTYLTPVKQRFQSWMQVRVTASWWQLLSPPGLKQTNWEP